jgi:DNA primase
MNTEKRVFHCFGCGAKGNMLDFIALKEDVSIKEAALLASEWFDTGATPSAAPRANLGPPEPRKKPQGPTKTNAPLTFQLRLQGHHPYLRERGIEAQTAEHFGVGYCNRGLLKGRIAIPIHDVQGNLVAYAGRWVSGELPEGEEKYKLPPGFKKNEVLFNLHRIAGNDHVVIVEGYFSVFRLHSLNFHAVALMGRTLSNTQEELLTRSGAKRLTLLLDGDEPGRAAAQELLSRLSRKLSVRVLRLPADSQPDTVDQDVLLKLLQSV